MVKIVCCMWELTVQRVYEVSLQWHMNTRPRVTTVWQQNDRTATWKIKIIRRKKEKAGKRVLQVQQLFNIADYDCFWFLFKKVAVFCSTRDVMVDKAHASGCSSQDNIRRWHMCTEHRTQRNRRTKEQKHKTWNTGRGTNTWLGSWSRRHVKTPMWWCD